MDNDYLSELRRKYITLGNCNEEDIKIKVVIPLLVHLGFYEDMFRYEYPVIKNKKFTDITVLVNGKIQLIVEVKKNSLKELRIDALHQLLSYLIIKNTEWGILTNGKEFLLVNNTIKDAEFKDKEIISFNLLDYYEENYLNYFSYKSLFVSKETYYLKYLSQFKVFKLKEKDNKTTLYTFTNTIEKYFEFCAKKYEFRQIEYLNVNDFREFLLYDIEESKKGQKQISSKATIINKYRHISGFYELFVKNELTARNPFRYISEDQMFERFDWIDYKECLDEINMEHIAYIFEYFDKHTNAPERNKIILLLCIFAGLSRDEIRFIKVDDLVDEEISINVNGRIIPLTKNFYERIKYYVDNIREKDAKVDYLFYSNYGDYAGQPLVKNTINAIIKKAAKAASQVIGREINITPENIRKVLIRKFFEAGFSIEEIVTTLNMEIDRVGYYISTEEIRERTVISKIKNQHPYLSLFQ